MRWTPLSGPHPRGDLKAVDIDDSDGNRAACLHRGRQPRVGHPQKPGEEPCIQGLGQGVPGGTVSEPRAAGARPTPSSLLSPGLPGIDGTFHGQGSRDLAIGRLLRAENVQLVRQAQGPPRGSPSLWVVCSGPLARDPGLTVTLRVTAPSRRSGGTCSSRAAAWISAQLDTAATSWNSLWTEAGGRKEHSACGLAASHGRGQRHAQTGKVPVTQR